MLIYNMGFTLVNNQTGKVQAMDRNSGGCLYDTDSFPYTWRTLEEAQKYPGFDEDKYTICQVTMILSER